LCDRAFLLRETPFFTNVSSAASDSRFLMSGSSLDLHLGEAAE
jgi:hypothetical protein